MTAAILAERPNVELRWRAALTGKDLADERLPSTVPGYFVDRYAFVAAQGERRGRAPTLPHAHAPSSPQERLRTLRAFLQPSERLGGWAADPMTACWLTPFYGELLERWTSFARELDLPQRVHTLYDARNGRWLDVFDRSVFYPGRPAIPGPIFWDFIDPADRVESVERFGPRCAIDFYCFMQQVHETIHEAQAGEPLLNEVVQAAIWVAFLGSNDDLWVFQRNRSSGLSPVREAECVARIPDLAARAAIANLDTATMIDGLVSPLRPRTYARCCQLARAFDTARIRYRTYLDQLPELIHSEARWLWLARRGRPIDGKPAGRTRPPA
jgi:hypothetical protein